MSPIRALLRTGPAGAAPDGAAAAGTAATDMEDVMGAHEVSEVTPLEMWGLTCWPRYGVWMLSGRGRVKTEMQKGAGSLCYEFLVAFSFACDWPGTFVPMGWSLGQSSQAMILRDSIRALGGNNLPSLGEIP